MNPSHFYPLNVEYRRIEELKPSPHNARTHSRKQIKQVARSIKQFGFTNPVLIDDTGRIISGHCRVEAAKLLGLQEVPTVKLSYLSKAQVRAYMIADNKLAENAGWDKSILVLEFQELIELGFDVEFTGFSMAEIDLTLGEIGESALSAENTVVEQEVGALPIINPGDLWQLGVHRLLHGDALDPRSYEQLLRGEKASAVFADPPYNVKIDGHVSGLGKTRHREFAMASGEMSEAEFTGFLTSLFKNLVQNSKDGSIHFICMDWRHLQEALAAGNATYDELKNLCVWNKNNGGMGSLYRSKHELVFVYKHGQAPHLNNVELGKHGRSRFNVWDYPGVNTFRPGRDEAVSAHPTVKPVALVADAILDVTRRKDIVLDPCGGSGTTLIAADRTGRHARLIEIDPLYCDAIVRRWQKATGKQAIHAETGRTFDDIAATKLAIVQAARQHALPELSQVGDA
ncbi:MAG: site-specific DNA-methyltransferase [Pseudorhodoplanes sp.]|jgi:DNA modification methylase|nr:site-specific DNA-methyltransferase [Pseudorhodoplanes sp.]